IVAGIPGGAPVSVVREDPKRKGLLFAGSETQVYVSFDDGDHWQSLRLNMAASSVRDLVIKDDDLVVGTHGRGIWILDDITPLRQIAEGVGSAKADAGSAKALAERDVVLFKPQPALRVRWNTNTDTPLPPAAPTTPWVNPGPFTVKLTVNGKTYSQPIVVKADPRVKTPALAMQQVYSLSKTMYYGAVDAQAVARQARALRDQIAARRPQASG